MLHLKVPGFGELEIIHLVSDFTGTLSEDGELFPGVRERMNRIAEGITIHVLTADTLGKAREALEDIPCKLHFFEEEGMDQEKAQYVARLGSRHVIALGNGRNDRAMLKSARVGVAVCLKEGCSVEALQAADLMVTSAADALDLLLYPKRLLAGLRS